MKDTGPRGRSRAPPPDGNLQRLVCDRVQKRRREVEYDQAKVGSHSDSSSFKSDRRMSLASDSLSRPFTVDYINGEDVWQQGVSSRGQQVADTRTRSDQWDAVYSLINEE
jgi:hypothetical protein